MGPFWAMFRFRAAPSTVRVAPGLLPPRLHMTGLDWVVIALYFVLATGIGLAMMKRGSRSLSDYFIGGRALPWWLAGTSMVATTFAADTPLAGEDLTFEVELVRVG